MIYIEEKNTSINLNEKQVKAIIAILIKGIFLIIHTHAAIDGNIDIIDLHEFEEASRQYQEIALDPKKQQLNV